MKEIWKDIEGYEKLYQVSNIGNVRSLNFHRTEKIQVLKPEKDKKGYLRVTLCKDGEKKYWQVHRLVATAFLPNSDKLPQVNHRDENPSNNRLENLEWCTAKYNINYGSHNQRMSEARRGMHFSEEHKRRIAEAHRGIPLSEEHKRKKSIPVAQYTKEGILITVFYGATEASRQTGINSGHITECCKGGRKSAGNFIWKYA